MSQKQYKHMYIYDYQLNKINAHLAEPNYFLLLHCVNACEFGGKC